MDASDTDLKKELDATLHARRDLGEEYEPALIDSFLEKVEAQVDSTVDRRVRRQLAEQQVLVARGGSAAPSPVHAWGERFAFGVITLVLAIPLSAIGATQEGLVGLVVSWAGIVGVNALHSRHTLATFLRPKDRRTPGELPE